MWLGWIGTERGGKYGVLTFGKGRSTFDFTSSTPKITTNLAFQESTTCHFFLHVLYLSLQYIQSRFNLDRVNFEVTSAAAAAVTSAAALHQRQRRRRRRRQRRRRRRLRERRRRRRRRRLHTLRRRRRRLRRRHRRRLRGYKHRNIKDIATNTVDYNIVSRRVKST